MATDQLETPDQPAAPGTRIRHITGVGIHELTTVPPAALLTSSSGMPGSPRARRTSHAGLDVPLVTRARAPTLAGEGLHPPISPSLPTPTPVAAERPLARCFVTLSIPDQVPNTNAKTNSNSNTNTPPQSPKGSPPPASPGRTPRTRTTSLPPKPTPRSSVGSLRAVSPSPTSPTFLGPSSPTAPSTLRRSQLNGTATKRPVPVRRSTLGIHRAASDAGGARAPASPVPFFFSPVHPPSTHPRWAYLEPGDFAPWLSVPEGAGTCVNVAVWVEDTKGGRSRWRRLPDVGGVVDLSRLRPIPPDAALPPNTLQWTLATHPKSVFYLPPSGDAKPESDSVNRAVERSLRETRMKKGASVGALHQLVNIQSVIADTRRSIDEVQRRIDALIAADGDRAICRRDVSERALRVHWVRDRVAEVERDIEEGKAKITLQRGRLAARRALLAAAQEREEANRSQALELSDQIARVESERTALLPQIHRLRAAHAQTLDAIFPISPISPPDLLYSILGVPLPIPLGPKDPAPPLSLPPALTPDGCPRVDERTTAAALGYAAAVVHLISGLGGPAAGLAYPVTYAGSKSHVRDVVSVMQGPRSFPLYARGVERYRYEYAVFLLNKDIEMLMLEADIRMLDLRHTLPNLKSLLLTLSSSDLPPPGPVSGPGWASGAASSASSRKPSSSSAFPRHASNTTLNLNPQPGIGPSPLASSHSVSLASASIHSICPTNEDASRNASTAVSPLPWREGHKELDKREKAREKGHDEPVIRVTAVGDGGDGAGSDGDGESDGTETADDRGIPAK